MNPIVFSSSSIQSWIFSIFLCIVVPLCFFWYFKKKNTIKGSSFLVGMAFSLLFTFILAVCLNTLILQTFGFTFLFEPDKHPVYAAIYGSVTAGIMASLGSYVGLKYAMKSRPGKENALVFGLGQGGMECILNGGAVYITNLIAAIFINSIGSEEYFKKLNLSPEDLKRTHSEFSQLANTPGYTYIISATYYLLSLCVHIAIAVFLYQAIKKGKSIVHLLIAVLIQTLSYAPMYVTSLFQLQSSLILLSIDFLYTFIIIFCFYQMYQKDKD